MERIGEVEFSMDLEHEQRLTAVEERSKSNSHRLDKVEASTAAINRLATSMEVMASRQEQVADTVDRLDGKVTVLLSTASPYKFTRDVLKALGFHDFDFYQTLLKNPMYTNEDVEDVVPGYQSGGYVAIIAHK